MVKYWGYSSFRPLQADIIESIAEGKDTLALMPTGGGKSITFQVPALAKDGLCIVVSPLIALMKDQIEKLNSLDIKAVAVHSGLTKEEVDIALDNCIYGDYKFLYISPERIANMLFQARVQKMNVNLVAVDEAHCISQWGYDFRPSYLNIAVLRKLLSADVPFLALTASATPKVADDIMQKLLFREKNILSTDFSRKNIVYLVRRVEDKGTYIINAIKKINGSGIIYVRSRKRCREIADILRMKGINADYYHAGLSYELRDKKQTAWSSGETRVIVATNAFGMGIDKADVRFVIHWEMPSSIEEYFQESGRAGRDGNKAYAVLLYSASDKKRLHDSINRKFPPQEKIRDTYEALCNYLQIPIGAGKGCVYDFKIDDLVSRFRLPIIETFNCLNFLQQEGYVEFTEEIYSPSRVHFIVNRDYLYKFQVSNEKFDAFIKLLLRTYTGMFSDYVAINEDVLSAKSRLPHDIIYSFLVRLASYKIINFIPGKKSSMVIFTEERLERKALRITPEVYSLVKERYVERINKMIEYADSQNKCRVVMMLNYFGQDADRCGTCDVCRKRNELGLSKYEFDIILAEIKKIVSSDSLNAGDIVKQINYAEDKVLKVLRWLIDHNKISRDDRDRMQWIKSGHNTAS